MKDENLTVPIKRIKQYSSYKGEITPEVDNIINRDFHAERPNTDVYKRQILINVAGRKCNIKDAVINGGSYAINVGTNGGEINICLLYTSRCV